MKTKGLIVLAMVALLSLAGLALPGASPRTVAAPAAAGPAVPIRAPLQATCNSCADCTAKLTSGSYTVVTLAADLLNIEGPCISLLAATDVTFDCAGHTIDGDDAWMDTDWGIGITGPSNDNITVRNCTISDFDRGIQIAGGGNHTVHDNHFTSNSVGIDIGSSGTNDLHANTVDGNTAEGIYLHNATDSSVNNNIVCDNTNLDFELTGGSGNTGDNNTCDKPDGWNDQGTTGCTSLCAGSVECNSCADCTSKLTGAFDRVVLTANINDYSSGDCITFGADNVEFNCSGHTIDGTGSGYGVYAANHTGNSIRDCTIQQFNRGIGLSNSDNTTVNQNTIQANTYEGLYLSSTSTGSDITFNAISANGAAGILLNNAPGNTIENNTITSNTGQGIYLTASSSNNTLSFNTIDNNDTNGIAVVASPGNTIQSNPIAGNGGYGIALADSTGSVLRSNSLRCNAQGLQLDNADNSAIDDNVVCSRATLDFDVSGDSTGNTGDNNHCDVPGSWNDAGIAGCTSACNADRCSTCSDGVQNGTEEGVDCGGSYCPPCAQCADEPTAKWAPHDTPCDDDWPTNDGPYIHLNTGDSACALIEVCNPELDYVIEDALLCCEYADYESRLGAPRRNAKIAACGYAHDKAYSNFFDENFNPATMKQCLAQYIIGSLEFAAVYMQGYFNGEISCAGDPPGSCTAFEVDPPAWEQADEDACTGPENDPDFQMGGHTCESYEFLWWQWDKNGEWNSDWDYRDNNDSFLDTPAHASINLMSTGTCVDYSYALTTLLRKAGYSQDDVLSVDGKEHAYNLVRFPGDSKWHYVDTVGNSGGGVYGGPGYPDPNYDSWYYTGGAGRHCTGMDGGCGNDALHIWKSNCPENESIYGCESWESLVSPPSVTTTVETVAAPVFSTWAAPAQADPTCTELHPCTVTYSETAGLPGPTYNLALVKQLSSAQITLGQSLELRLYIANAEAFAIDATVQERLIPNVAYDLDAQAKPYEGFTSYYVERSLSLPAHSLRTLTVTVVPSDVGYYAFPPTYVFAAGHSYRAHGSTVKVVCSPNGTCEPGENPVYCPADCPTGMLDGYCDMAADGRIDPDCQYEVEPDRNPTVDTDADGVLDGSDRCPLTPAGDFVDAEGCACGQKICPMGVPYSTTVGICNPATAACEYLADADQDAVPDTEDNCPNAYNPEQYDCDGNHVGDQCEFAHVDADTTLVAGCTYHIADDALDGAVTITASNVTFDCNGATLVGTGAGYGIYLPDNVANVTVRNCTVQGYRYGIYVDGASDNQIISNTLGANNYGILLGFAANNTISNNRAESNSYAGLYLEGATGNAIFNNTLNNNGGLGIFLHTSSDNDLAGNEVCHNSRADFYLYDSTNTGTGNTCDNPGDWNDEGAAGCTSTCGYSMIYLPIVTKSSQ
jgi:parallel beta-helix repeat protein